MCFSRTSAARRISICLHSCPLRANVLEVFIRPYIPTTTSSPRRAPLASTERILFRLSVLGARNLKTSPWSWIGATYRLFVATPRFWIDDCDCERLAEGNRMNRDTGESFVLFYISRSISIPTYCVGLLEREETNFQLRKLRDEKNQVATRTSRTLPLNYCTNPLSIFELEGCRNGGACILCIYKLETKSVFVNQSVRQSYNSESYSPETTTRH